MECLQTQVGDLQIQAEDLQIQVGDLQRIAHELLYPGTEVCDTPIYADDFGRLNSDVLHRANALYHLRGETIEQEASICLALLMGYNATIYNYGDKESKKQTVLNRCWIILERLPASLLKCQLLTYCYGEIYEKELAQEAHDIIDSWQGRPLTAEEREIAKVLQVIEENPYPHEWVEG